ncbi:hypothetical protein ACP3T3_04405 [Chryseobacterium sp. CBSDS_008]|uniref:hypothetical protein n=1 Tax=Chryseobacterium sp. CBSDS_008 TaxID=3415265 RepID=UPI003CF3B8A0
MKEKVYSIDNYWDMTVIEGIADYNGKPYYYTNIFSESEDEWTNEYLLTPLPEDIFTLGLKIWNYWLYWLKTYNHTKVPHQGEYAKQRENHSPDFLMKVDIETDEWLKAEQNYQNQFVFDHYLKANQPTAKAKGVFNGKIDGTDAFVEWTNHENL